MSLVNIPRAAATVVAAPWPVGLVTQVAGNPIRPPPIVLAHNRPTGRRSA